MIFGLEAVPLEDGYTPLEAVVVVKCLDEEGCVTLLTRCTDGVMTWDSVGMLTVALDISRNEALNGFIPDDEDES